jgi:SAM-dependent methyltransferase
MSPAMNYAHLADIYDTYVTTSRDIPFFSQEANNISGEALELMAGTGRVSLPLLRQGVRLTCVDLYPQMLAVLEAKAAEEGLQVETHAMDVCELDLGKQFALIFIPFNAFAEILSTSNQMKALIRIHQHLAPEGLFICTLHNPEARLARVDGQLRLWGNFPRHDQPGRLLLWGLENYHPENEYVEGVQIFELYNDQGVLQTKRMSEIHFSVLVRDQFEQLAQKAGFKIAALYGDYDYSHFSEERSPFMIWKLNR